MKNIIKFLEENGIDYEKTEYGNAYYYNDGFSVPAITVTYVDTSWHWSGRLFKWNGVSSIKYKIVMRPSVCGYAEACRCDKRKARYNYCNNSID